MKEDMVKFKDMGFVLEDLRSYIFARKTKMMKVVLLTPGGFTELSEEDVSIMDFNNFRKLVSSRFIKEKRSARNNSTAENKENRASGDPT